jgi:hypothetical protein
MISTPFSTLDFSQLSQICDNWEKGYDEERVRKLMGGKLLSEKAVENGTISCSTSIG